MVSKKLNMLWIGDAGCQTGFARVTHQTIVSHPSFLERFNVTVLGLNSMGDPNPYPYDIYPAAPGGDGFGIGRIKKMLEIAVPDVVVVQNDPWNIPAYTKALRHYGYSGFIVGTVAVDGKNCRGSWMNDLDLCNFWTKFGLDQARLGGYTKPGSVIPLGIDLEQFRPIPKEQARAQCSLLSEEDRDKFIVGSFGRNQYRKRLDLVIEYFAGWVHRFKPNALLMLHVAPTLDEGFDLKQLCEYHGILDRLRISEPELNDGIPENHLNLLYSLPDVGLFLPQGEGWGLCIMESMACGTPCAVADYAALGEWPGNAVRKISCTASAVTPKNINVVGGVADKKETIYELNALYNRPELRSNLVRKGLERVALPDFNWSNISLKFADVVSSLFSVKGLPEASLEVDIV